MSDQYPRMLFKSPGPHEFHGGKFDYLIVVDEEEANDALAAGWSLSTDAAKAANEKPKAEPAQVADDAAPTRDELKQKADELGLEYPKNIPTEKLAEMVEAKLAEPQGNETAPE